MGEVGSKIEIIQEQMIWKNNQIFASIDSLGLSLHLVILDIKVSEELQK